MRQRTILSTAVTSILLASLQHAPDAQAGAAPAALEELIVTAQRRQESILETPVTITALTGDVLEQQNVRSLTEMTALTPGLEIEPDGGRTSIRLRGLSTSDGTPSAENATALHVDNVYISHRTTLEGYFYDVDRVEVLQGPQGTLYGRNAAAGSINIISRRPVQELQGSAEIEFGNYGRRRVQGMLNIPVTDTFALRGAFQSLTSDGYFDSGVDENRGTYGRLAAQWNPTDRISVYLKGDFGDTWRRGNGTGLLGVQNVSNPNNWTVRWFDEGDWFNDSLAHPEDVSNTVDGINQSFASNKFYGFSTELAFDITDTTQFLINAARIEEKYRSRTVNVEGEVNDGGVGYGFYGGPANDRVKGRPWLEKIVDARLQGNFGGQLAWTLGYFWFEDDTNEPGGNANGIAFHAADSLAESDAIYGQLTWTIMDRLHLTAGGRRTEDWKQWDFQVVLFDSFVVGGSNGLLTKEWENDDWKLGVAWDLSDDSMLYANVSTGYRSGSWFPGPIPQYDPEFVDAVEIGWKGRFADNRVEMSFNVYQYDYQDMAVQFDAFNTISQENEIGMFNLGASEVTGANLSGSWLMTDNDLLTFNVDYTDTEITEFDFTSAAAQYGPQYQFNGVFNWTGLSLPNTTPWRVTVAWNHTFNFGGGATLDSRVQGLWSDGRYYSYREDVTPQYEVPARYIDSYLTLDWNLMYRPADADWFIGGYISNLTDEIVPNSVGAGANPQGGTLAGTLGPDEVYVTGSLRPPRQFGIRIGYEF